MEKLPESIGICCDGIIGAFKFHNIVEPEIKTGSMELNLLDGITVDNHICRFLGATRKLRLEDKKRDFKSKFGLKKEAIERNLIRNSGNRFLTLLDQLR